MHWRGQSSFVWGPPLTTYLHKQALKAGILRNCIHQLRELIEPNNFKSLCGMLQGILEADALAKQISACMRFCRPLVARTVERDACMQEERLLSCSGGGEV